MTRKLPRKDVVIIGLGWTGSIMANELTDEGLDVVAIERGPWRDAATDFPPNYDQDELRYRIRHELFLRPDQTTFTFRNKMDQTALPIRTWGAFMPPNGVGGGGVHWNAETWRFLPSDFVLKTHLTERYGAAFLPPDMTIQDWGVTYDELEPYYDRFEYLCGTSGQAGNLKGQIQEGGNPFEGPRSRPYPNPPQAQPFSHTLVRKGGAGARLQTVSATLRQHVAGLQESARRPPRSLHLLRLLRMVWLRQQFEGEPADDDPAGAGAKIEFPRARQLRGDADQYRPLRQARDRRHLRRYERRGMGAAGRSRDPGGLYGLQRSAAAALGHRQALRSDRQRRRDRPQFHPSDDFRRHRLLRQGESSTSIRSSRRARSACASTSSTATISITARTASSAAAIWARSRPTAARSRRRPCRRERRAGARHGRRRCATIISARSSPEPASTAASTAIATSISISIRPTRIASAAR